MRHPFTCDELLRVFSFVASDEDAAAMARAALESPGDVREQEGGRGLTFRTVPTVDFSEDTLILLSLQSDETAEKVRQFRLAARAGLAESESEIARWESRRDELKAWLDQAGPR